MVCFQYSACKGICFSAFCQILVRKKVEKAVFSFKPSFLEFVFLHFSKEFVVFVFYFHEIR